MRPDYQLSQLDVLQAEAIHVMREVAAEFERPVLLFSGGKDSVVMLALAEQAFWPARIPFPVMHVDTGHNFPEVLEFRDRRVAELGVRLVIASVQALVVARLGQASLPCQGAPRALKSISMAKRERPGALKSDARWKVSVL